MKLKSIKLHVLCLWGMSLIASSAFSEVRPDSLAVSAKTGKVPGSQALMSGEQYPEKMLQSYSFVTGERLMHRPAFQMENSFYGVLPGLTVRFQNGLPSSQSLIFLRGRIPLILVDGIPRSDANIPVSQIESLSVVKDGLGLSQLGMSSGNGILNIKTKRGETSKMQVGFTVQRANSKEIFRPEHLDAYQYGMLLNEARANDGLSALYSQQDLDLYRSGEKPYTHPNVDWMDLILKESAPIEQYSLNFTGGTKDARYFVDLNYYNQAGFIKEDNSINSYSTSNNYKKFSLRTNLDIELSPTTTLQTNFFGQMFREIATGKSVSNIYSALNGTPHNAYPVMNPDSTLGGSPQYTNNIYGQTIKSGYYLYPKSDLNIDVILTQRFTGAFEGMYMKGTYSYNSSYREALNRSKNFGVYYFWQDPNDTTEPTSANYNQLTSDGTQANATAYNRQNRLLNGSLEWGYDYESGKHYLQSKLTGNYSNYLLMGTGLPFKTGGVSLSESYSYDNRFLAELALNMYQSSQYKPGHRWGFFPAAGIGWVMSNESWFSEKVPFLSYLKLRTSYGVNGDNGASSFYRLGTGNVSDYYNYMKYYNSYGSVYSGGSTIISSSYLVEATLPYISTWDHINRFTLGTEIKAFNDKLSATIEFFNNEYSKISQMRISNNSAIYGVALPAENTMKHRLSGLEVDLAYSQELGAVKLYGNVNATLYKSKLKHNGEPQYPETYMQRVGKPFGATFGRVADGLFADQAEVDNYLSSYAKVADYTPQPGDIKYRDLNGDKIIDNKDVEMISTTKPLVDYGIFMGISWKGFDFSMQWAGAANREVIYQDLPFGVSSSNAYGRVLTQHLNRWSASNPNPDADYPRLSSAGNTYNQRNSTFWLKNADYLRLKNIELSYNLPSAWTKKLAMSSVKFFVNGCNLLTISPLKNVDPELFENFGNVVPNIKSINTGVSVNF